MVATAHAGIDDDKAKGGCGEKTVLDGHIPPPMPKHMRELVRSVADNLYRKRPMLPRYRALYEGDDGEDTP